MWPEIRFAYPDAELHIFYEVQQWIDKAILLNSEVGIRARYVVRRIEALKRHGVVLRGALPPVQLAQELLQADVMLYPCSPVRHTEGFSVSTMESCAAGAIPVITDADALGEIYGQSGACVIPRSPGREWTDTYLEVVLKLLGDSGREKLRDQVREFSRRFDWGVVSGQWQEMIERRGREKHG
jgi:glycosyltransferase involved in cell wall biosynthesis